MPGWLTSPKVQQLHRRVIRRVRTWEEPEARLQRRQRLLTKQARWWGSDGRPTMNCRALIADDLEELGRFGEAVPLRQRVFDAYRDHFGESDIDTLNAQTSLAVALYRAGDSDRARTVAEMLRNVGQRDRGTEDLYTLWAEDFLMKTGAGSPPVVFQSPVVGSVSSSWKSASRSASTGTARITSPKPRRDIADNPTTE